MSATGFERSEFDDLLPLLLDQVAPVRLFRIDPVKAHAQAILDHGHGVVAEPAEGAQIVDVFPTTGVTIGDMLDGRGREFQKTQK